MKNSLRNTAKLLENLPAGFTPVMGTVLRAPYSDGSWVNLSDLPRFFSVHHNYPLPNTQISAEDTYRVA